MRARRGLEVGSRYLPAQVALGQKEAPKMACPDRWHGPKPAEMEKVPASLVERKVRRGERLNCASAAAGGSFGTPFD